MFFDKCNGFFGWNTADRDHNDRHKHQGNMLYRPEPQSSLFHRSSHIWQSPLHDRTDEVKYQTHQKLRMGNNEGNQTDLIIRIRKFFFIEPPVKSFDDGQDEHNEYEIT